MSKKNMPNKKKGKRVPNNNEPQVIINVAPPVPDNKEEKKTFFQRWFRWDRIGVLAAIVSAIVGVITIWPPIGKARAIASIDKSIANIEQNFHPENIKISYLSTPDFQMVKDFQTKTLNLVTYWKAVRDIKPASHFKNYDSKKIATVITSNLNTLTEFSHEIPSILKLTSDLRDYGSNNFISAYIPKGTRILVLLEQCEKFEKSVNDKTDDVRNIIYSLRDKYGNDTLEDKPAEELFPILKGINKIFNSLDDYQFIDEFFQYIIEQNSIYMIYLKTKI